MASLDVFIASTTPQSNAYASFGAQDNENLKEHSKTEVKSSSDTDNQGAGGGQNNDFEHIILQLISSAETSSSTTTTQSNDNTGTTSLLSSEAENLFFLSYRQQDGTQGTDNNAYSTLNDLNVTTEDYSALDIEALNTLPEDVIASILNTIEPESQSSFIGTSITDAEAAAQSIDSLLPFTLAISEEGESDQEAILAALLTHTQSNASAIIDNTTPDDLAELQELLTIAQSGELTEEQEEQLQELISAFIMIAPPQAQSSTAQINSAPIAATITQGAKEALPTNTQNAASALSDESSEIGAPRPAPLSEEDSLFNATLSNTESTDSTAQAQLNNLTKNDQITHGEHLQQAQQNSVENQNITNNSQGIIPDSEPSQEWLTGFGQAQFNAQTPLQSTLTQNVTQAPSAAQAHPATQMVSATIQKAVQSGDSTSIRIMLDPAELGRVEVKMSIDKDNNTQLVLTAEKPETFMMLKRDSDILERAIADSGLDLESDISFEMSQDSETFGQNKDNNDMKANNNDLGADAQEVIETEMSWRIDPNSGNMHYNILT